MDPGDKMPSLVEKINFERMLGNISIQKKDTPTDVDVFPYLKTYLHNVAKSYCSVDNMCMEPI